MVIITPVANTVISFVVGGLLAYTVSAIKKKKQTDDAISKGVMFLLRNNLIARCDVLIESDSSDMNKFMRELDSIRAEHQIYQSLGGNGDIDSRLEILEERVIRRV